MKKVLKFSFSLSVFCIGFILNPSVSQAFQQEPSDSLNSTTHTCYKLTDYEGSRWRVFDCDDCIQKKGTVLLGSKKGKCSKT